MIHALSPLRNASCDQYVFQLLFQAFDGNSRHSQFLIFFFHHLFMELPFTVHFSSRVGQLFICNMNSDFNKGKITK